MLATLTAPMVLVITLVEPRQAASPTPAKDCARVLSSVLSSVPETACRFHSHETTKGLAWTSRSRARHGNSMQNRDMRLGIAHHLGWAVVVLTSANHEVFDRRRIELVEPGLPSAPIHHEGGPHFLHRTGKPLDDDELAKLVARVRASAQRATSTALDEIECLAPEPIVAMSVRAWPADFPEDIAIQRRAPYESRADSVMYCKVLAEAARNRDWKVHVFNAKTVEADAGRVLGARAKAVLDGPRATLGPPWSKDHRTALAATVLIP